LVFAAGLNLEKLELRFKKLRKQPSLLLLANQLRILNPWIGFCSRFELGKIKEYNKVPRKKILGVLTVYLYTKCIANGLDIPNLRIGLYNTFELGII
jgi:hypothetical protein